MIKKPAEHIIPVMALLIFLVPIFFTANALAVTITSTDPAGGAIDVSTSTAITVTFSAEMDPSTITKETFFITKITDGCVPDINSTVDCLTYVDGNITVSGTTATFTPTTALTPNIEYSATILTCLAGDPSDPFTPTLCIKDTNGNLLNMGLENVYKWSFKTAIPTDCGGKGDINCDKNVDITDAITGLQICVGMTPFSYIGADANADSRIGIEDIIYVLRVVAGVTP